MKSRKFFRIRPDYTANNCWYLKSPLDSNGTEIDPRKFTEGVDLSLNAELSLPIRRTGASLNFNFCDFDMVVVSKKIAEKLEKFAGGAVQRFPVSISEVNESFEILNVRECISCIDEVNSEFTKWTVEDENPDKVGKFRMFLRLKINDLVVGERHIFRISEWPIALIVSEEMKTLLELEDIFGIKFELVT